VIELKICRLDDDGVANLCTELFIAVNMRRSYSSADRAVGKWDQPVLSFWQKAIPAAVDEDGKECAGDGKRWAGPVLCFDNRGHKS
jgi:hypothetical protein